MASVRKSIILKGISGRVGDIVIKQYRSGTVITKVPDMSGILPTKSQKKNRRRFSDAVKFAKSIVADPDEHAAWKSKTRKGTSVYHAAMRAYLKEEVPQLKPTKHSRKRK